MGLSSKKIESFKRELLTIRKALSKKLANNMSVFKGKSFDYGNDVADISLEDIEESMCMSLSGNERDVIGKIDRALEKMSEGTYGVCDISGEEIPAKRLEAIPYATMTVESQRKLEREGF